MIYGIVWVSSDLMLELKAIGVNTTLCTGRTASECCTVQWVYEGCAYRDQHYSSFLLIHEVLGKSNGREFRKGMPRAVLDFLIEREVLPSLFAWASTLRCLAFAMSWTWVCSKLKCFLQLRSFSLSQGYWWLCVLDGCTLGSKHVLRGLNAWIPVWVSLGEWPPRRAHFFEWYTSLGLVSCIVCNSLDRPFYQIEGVYGVQLAG